MLVSVAQTASNIASTSSTIGVKRKADGTSHAPEASGSPSKVPRTTSKNPAGTLSSHHHQFYSPEVVPTPKKNTAKLATFKSSGHSASKTQPSAPSANRSGAATPGQHNGAKRDAQFERNDHVVPSNSSHPVHDEGPDEVLHNAKRGANANANANATGRAGRAQDEGADDRSQGDEAGAGVGDDENEPSDDEPVRNVAQQVRVSHPEAFQYPAHSNNCDCSRLPVPTNLDFKTSTHTYTARWPML